jgi:hypothetical protein
MDEELKQLLRQLLDAQREQTELLRKHVLPLWTRIRFSLLALLLLMTAVALGSGFTVWAVRSANTPPPATATRVWTLPTQGTPSITAKATEWLIRADSSRSR